MHVVLDRRSRSPWAPLVTTMTVAAVLGLATGVLLTFLGLSPAGATEPAGPEEASTSEPAGEPVIETSSTQASANSSGKGSKLGKATRHSGRGTLSVPRLGIKGARIVPVGVNGAGGLAVGGNVRDVFTWRDGVRPGQPGSAVLAGHTWSRGDGVFDNLGQLRVGDRVRVGRVTFRVSRSQRVRGMSQRQVQRLFSDRGPARVVLITCGDRSAATGVYATRIIVTATRTPR